MNEKDDEQWLAALAGKSDPLADPATNAHAEALRRAMLARREDLERGAQPEDFGEFERLRIRLKNEGLLQDEATQDPRPKSKAFIAWVANWFPAKAEGSFISFPAWSLAANLVLAVVVVFQLVTPDAPKPDEADVLRGSQATILRVSDPEARLAELTEGLDKRNVRYVVKQSSVEIFELIIQANDEVFDYLVEQRIEANVIDEVIFLDIKKIEK